MLAGDKYREQCLSLFYFPAITSPSVCVPAQGLLHFQTLMKSERRHELQTNSLAQALSHAPEFFRAHGSKVLLVVIVILLASLLLYQRSRKGEEQLQVGWLNISNARSMLNVLSTSVDSRETPANLFQMRRQMVDNINGSLNSILASSDRHIAAEAHLLRCYLNWALANLPEIPQAATQPSLKLPGTSSEYLKLAEESYRRILSSYSDQTSSVVSAQLGLAAIAENRHDWDAATKIYQAIQGDPNILTAYKTLAERRLEALETIRQPVYLAPTTLPATTAPTTQAN